MRVRNLYIADIRMIQHIRTVNRLGEHYTLVTKPVKQAIVYRDPKLDKVRDVLSRKKYELGLPLERYHGQEYVVHLDHYPIHKVLEDSGYDKLDITKRKLLKLINSSDSNFKGNIL